MKEKIVVKLDDVPSRSTVHGWIDAKYKISEKFKDMPHEVVLDPYLKFKIKDFDYLKAAESVKEASDIYGWWGFLSHFKNTDDLLSDRAVYYGGFSIMHNPDLYYEVPEHASALGEPKYNVHDFFTTELGRETWLKMEEKKITPKFYMAVFGGGLPAAKQFLLNENLITGKEEFDWNQPFKRIDGQLRNGYFDTYGFRYLTSAAKHGYHGEFFKNRWLRNMCRSRTAYINGSLYQEKIADYMWHYDEPIFMNLRINIPLQTSDSYVFEIKDQYKGKFETGYAYTWNTEIVHRVYAEKPDTTQRIHLVIGSSPWFDYIEEEKAYVSNEFFGEMHPFDMVANGHVIKNIEVVQ
jgi:hypothetical protein